MAKSLNRKQGKRERRKQQLARESRKRRLYIIIPVIVIVVALGAFAFIRLRPVEGISSFGAQLRGHDSGVEFAETSLPPVGGSHNPQWQNCGTYFEPVDVGRAVHSMEHGAVWVAYQPDLPAEDVSVLQDIVRGQSYVLLSPYPELKSDIVLTAWGVQLEIDVVTDERIEAFIDRYRGAGPEQGAPCSGGVGQPIQ